METHSAAKQQPKPFKDTKDIKDAKDTEGAENGEEPRATAQRTARALRPDIGKRKRVDPQISPIFTDSGMKNNDENSRF